MNDLILLSWFLLGFLIVRTLIALVNAVSRPYLSEATKVDLARVSILVPARNEENNLPRLLHSLLQLDYPNVEVWVCDDQSTDKTASLLQEWQSKDSRLHFFRGEPLPPSWTGKNFACHQLAQIATGDYLLFIDADISLSPQALQKALAYFRSHRLTLLSIFPQQKMQTTAEKVSVPFMNWALLNLLPLPFVLNMKNPLFAAANGQFMLFSATEYHENQWHDQVKDKHVEDIWMVRRMKQAGKRVAVLLGNQDVYCRMYTSYKEGLQGFSRNVHEFFLGSRLLMFLFWLGLMTAPAVIFLSFGLAGFFVYLVILLLNRLLVAWASRQSVCTSLLFHPLNMFFFTHVMIHNICLAINHTGKWKGRSINI